MSKREEKKIGTLQNDFFFFSFPGMTVTQRMMLLYTILSLDRRGNDQGQREGTYLVKLDKAE